MPESIEETVFTVARDGKAIAPYVGSRESAEVDVARIQGAMRVAKLEPNVYLGIVTKTTTYGAPEPIEQ